MQLIHTVEQTRRDDCGGDIGYFLGTGIWKLALSFVRQSLLRTARVQAGAGVVYESVPLKQMMKRAPKPQAS